MIVGGPVSSVELVLDGNSVGIVRAPSWSRQVDLEDEILPHELVARALNEKGEEVARTRQWLNLPRAPAEVEALLEKGKDGRVTGARLSWQSLTGEEPKRVEASINGKPLTVSAQQRVAIPAYDPEQVQLLTVELEFDRAVRARKDVVFGGRTGAEAGRELTAVPIRMRPGDKTPASRSSTGSCAEGTARSRSPPSRRDPGSSCSSAIRTGWTGSAVGAGIVPQRPGDRMCRSRRTVRFAFSGRGPPRMPGTGLVSSSFRSPRPSSRRKPGFGQCSRAWPIPSHNRRLPGSPTRSPSPGSTPMGVFGRRVVLMVVEPGSADASEYPPETVRRFLASLHVPLYVWSVGPLAPAFAGWNEAVDVSSEKGFKDSAKKIRADLESQRIVWVDGKLLPQTIDLAPGAAEIALVH